MKKTINVGDALKGTPRPHHLVGEAEYTYKNGIHTLKGDVIFKSKGNPSIEDRVAEHLPNPHVNSGEAFYAIWNGGHIMGDFQGYTERIIVDEIRIKPKKIISADTLLHLKVWGGEKKKRIDRKGIPYYLGTIEGNISQHGEILVELSSNYFARK
jgi:hypothetical protein